MILDIGGVWFDKQWFVVSIDQSMVFVIFDFFVSIVVVWFVVFGGFDVLIVDDGCVW